MTKNFGMMRVELLKAAAVAGRAIHHTRDYNDSRPPPSHIDTKLSKKNVFLGQYGESAKGRENLQRYMSRHRKAMAEHKEATGRKCRSDANTAVDMVFARSDLGEQAEKKFNDRAWFLDTVHWVGERFGSDNIIGAVLHMDEPDRLNHKVHPHIHVMITPGIQTEKGRKISAKETFPMGCYADLQTEYIEKVGVKHGLSRGEKKAPEVTHQHVTPRDFKARTRRKEMALRAKIDKIKDPEKLRQMANQLIHDVSPGLVSQDIMKERIEAERAEKNRKTRESIQNLEKRAVEAEQKNETLSAKNSSQVERLEKLKTTIGLQRRAISDSISSRSVEPLIEYKKVQKALAKGKGEELER